MRTTSHFVGIAVDSAQFADLFVELQKYFIGHDISHAIELQNILSLHVTLYYLPAILHQTGKTEILKDLFELSSSKEFTISSLQGKYFGEPGKGRVGYIGCESNETFNTINLFFAEKYKHTGISENALAFVPHISLFRILDSEAFAPHKAEVDVIIDASIPSINVDTVLGGLRLFQVNSDFRPEIQIPVLN